MRKGLLISSMVLLGLGACSTVPGYSNGSQWIDTGSDPKYPSSIYITASGCGKDIGTAREEANVNLARKMLTSIDTIQRVNSITTNTDGVLHYSNTSESTDKLVSQVSLAGLSYPEVRHTGKGVCVLGVMDKGKARIDFRQDIASGEKIVRSIKKKGYPTALDALKADIQLIGTQQRINRDKESLALLSHRPFQTISSKDLDIAEKGIRKLSRIKVIANVQGMGNQNPELQEAFENQLKRAGFTVTNSDPVFILKVSGVHRWLVNPLSGTQFDWHLKVSLQGHNTDVEQDYRGSYGAQNPGDLVTQTEDEEEQVFERDIAYPFIRDTFFSN